ncbi:alpha-amylase family protein [Propioniciclava soli]|uniref:Alpha-amylase family protein n=1 Tax=Propioniciclava soli TaxID=2775081 RepID=A0ABZ3C612_9ACTN
MTWTDHVIWWHVYPLGFTGAPIRPASDDERALTHRLGHLTGWLDHLVGLGCNGLLLGPIFTSTSHGYDTLDHLEIDPRLGDDADLDGLIAAAHARGVRIVLDGVFNHVGEHHPLFRAALASPDAPENALFRIDWSSGEPRPADFEGHGQLVAFNHDSDAVVDLVADVMLHWLRRGIDGWRLDAAYAVPAEFWAKVLPRVRAEFPEAWILGEMIHGDYAGYARASGLDSVTQYELWKALWSSLLDANFFELDHALGRHNALLATFAPNTFVGNHDVTRIATRVGQAKAVLAATVLFTVGGVPSVYYGDEEGFTGTKREDWGGDDDVRPYLPVHPEELSALGAPVRHAYEGLIALRRQHPWLIRARVEPVELSNTLYVYDAVGEGGERLRVELDADAASARITRDGTELWRTASDLPA